MSRFVSVLTLVMTGCLFYGPQQGAAQNQPVVLAGDSASDSGLDESERLILARDFLSRISAGFKRADQQLQKSGAPAESPAIGLAEGETLIFQVRLGKKLVLDSPLMGQIRQGQVALSLRDFIASLEFPILFDAEKATATGWYIRQNKPFALNMATREVRTDNGTFTLSPDLQMEDGDLFVQAAELERWFGIKLRPVPSALDLFVESPVPLPVEERLARRNLQFHDQRIGPAILPAAPENRQAIDFPFVDVATRSSFIKTGSSGESRNTQTASVLTTGDLAYGTLSTQSQLDKEDKLRSFRANFKRESLEPELLGPLNARRYEIGDLSTVPMPIGGGAQEQGVRVSNIHPLRNYLRPSTTISGTTFPGWDVELYRDNQLVAFQTSGDDGFYSFDNVDLYSSDNNFRIVLYGPQGEIQEEDRYIPVDNKRLSGMGGAYDISLTRQDIQTYNSRDVESEDEGALRLKALYEHPVGESSAALLGFETQQRQGDQRSTLHAGASTTLAQTLLNLDTAVDDRGEMAAELVARRNINTHEIRNELKWATDYYDTDNNDDIREIFNESFSVYGPLPFYTGNRARYNLGYDYSLSSNDDTATLFSAGLSASLKRLSISQNFQYGINDFSGIRNERLDSFTTLGGSLYGYRLRLNANYEIMPDNNLDRVIATVQHNITNNLEAGIGIERRVEQKLTQGNAYLNWAAGFARISPEITYNSDNDLTATLNTRFGIARDPLQNKIKMFDTQITSSGALSAFVFLDKDGDSVFNNDDEALPDVVVAAPQNGGRAITDEKGYAFFKRMQNLRLTDVYVDPSSLKDPFWIASFAGSSVLPREGYVAQLQFPIHVAGEMDGTVYAQDESGNNRPLRGITLSLYTMTGTKTLSTTSESDGFYLFNQIPPGQYYLVVESNTIREKGLASPAPQNITIGYEGTVLYGNNVYLRQGLPDVALSFLSNTSAVTSHPENLEGKRIVLNLGSYKSQMLMGLTWFTLKTRFSSLFRDAELLEKPSASAADGAGRHTLRVALQTHDIQKARQICTELAKREQSCGIEILPPATGKQAAATVQHNG